MVAKTSTAADRQATGVRLAVASGALATEMFSMSLVFLVVEASGISGTVYLVPQLAAAAASGLFGARLVTNLAPFKVAAGGDWLRALAASAAVATTTMGISLWAVVASAVAVAAVRPHHDAGVMSGLSALRLDRAAVGRMASSIDNTLRAARVLGPGVASLIALVAGSQAVLVVSAVLFTCAAVLLQRTEQRTRGESCEPKSQEALGRSVDEPAPDSASSKSADGPWLLRYVYMTQAVNCGAWYVGFVYCVAVLVSQEHTQSSLGLGSFGIATLCYGVGNLGAGLVLTSHQQARTASWVAGGRAWAGLCLLLVAWSDTLPLLCLAAALLAAGTPPADQAFIKHVQATLHWKDVARAFRRKLICEYSGNLAAVCVAGIVLDRAGVRGTIFCAGLLMIMVAAMGLPLIAKERTGAGD